MNPIIIVGCGRLGAELANSLFHQKMQVVVVDENETSFFNLPPEFVGRRVQGSALNQGVLERAGIHEAVGLAAVTNSDSQNAVIAYLAENVFHVPRVISRNYDPKLRGIHEIFGLQVISSTSWGAHRIEEILFQMDFRLIFSAGNGEIDIYEFALPDQWHGKKLGELLSGIQCNPVALTRYGKATIPDLDKLLETGDIVQISINMDDAKTLRQRLIKKEG